MSRFNRTGLLVGQTGIERLKKSRVVVCGLGAVGSYAVEALARAGVGTIRIVDYDVFDESNINRQLFALDSTIGIKKTEIAAKRIRDINPDCSIEVFDSFIDELSTPSIIEGNPDVLIDAIDSLSAKVYLIADAYRANINVVTSMGAAGKFDANLITSGDLSETHTCPLARVVRRRLHRQNIYQGVRCVFSTELMQKKQPENKLPYDDKMTSPVLGSISYLTGIFGLKVAYETIDYILNSDSKRLKII